MRIVLDKAANAVLNGN